MTVYIGHKIRGLLIAVEEADGTLAIIRSEEIHTQEIECCFHALNDPTFTIQVSGTIHSISKQAPSGSPFDDLRTIVYGKRTLLDSGDLTDGDRNYAAEIVARAAQLAPRKVAESGTQLSRRDK